MFRGAFRIQNLMCMYICCQRSPISNYSQINYFEINAHLAETKLSHILSIFKIYLFMFVMFTSSRSEEPLYITEKIFKWHFARPFTPTFSSKTRSNPIKTPLKVRPYQMRKSERITTRQVTCKNVPLIKGSFRQFQICSHKHKTPHVYSRRWFISMASSLVARRWVRPRTQWRRWRKALIGGRLPDACLWLGPRGSTWGFLQFCLSVLFFVSSKRVKMIRLFLCDDIL